MQGQWVRGAPGMQGRRAGAPGAGGCRGAGWGLAPGTASPSRASREPEELEEPMSLSAVPHRCAPHAKRLAAGGGGGEAAVACLGR